MIYAIIVIYNKECFKSETLEILKLYKEKINIIIFDNGNETYNNKLYCDFNGFNYYSYNENLGLSKAYNRAVESISICEDDYIFIFDDDTILTKEYILEAFDIVELRKYDVILPVVMAGNFILSPSNKKHKCGSKVVKNIDEIKMNNITAINSGMIVSGRVYQKIKYDERLFLDMVDHRFMDCVRKAGYEIIIMKSIIYQNYSRQEKNNYESSWNRYCLYKKDFKKYCEINNAKWFYILSIFKFKICNAIRYKKINFLIK